MTENSTREGDTPLIETRTLAHIIKFKASDIGLDEHLKWTTEEKLDTLPLAPAVKEIISCAGVNDQFFFEEFRVPAR